jgi:hypothetical protein
MGFPLWLFPLPTVQAQPPRRPGTRSKMRLLPGLGNRIPFGSHRPRSVGTKAAAAPGSVGKSCRALSLPSRATASEDRIHTCSYGAFPRQSSHYGRDVLRRKWRRAVIQKRELDGEFSRMRRDIFVDSPNEHLKPSALALAQTFPSVFSKPSRPHSPRGGRLPEIPPRISASRPWPAFRR